ncbi:MAG: hypothetical protein ACRD19_05970 [Terriglobia bacterium]
MGSAGTHLYAKTYINTIDPVTGTRPYSGFWPGSIANWINPAAFAVPAPETFGNAGRNLVGGSGAWQLDLSLAKDSPLTERVHLQFRAEEFNTFNHEYGTPQSDLPAGRHAV